MIFSDVNQSQNRWMEIEPSNIVFLQYLVGLEYPLLFY